MGKLLIDKKELNLILRRFNAYLDESLKVIIIGSASLFIRNVNSRNQTEDIDMFVFNDEKFFFGEIEKFITNSFVGSNLINSDGYEIVQEMLYFTPREHIVRWEENKLSMLNIYLLSIEAMVAFKIVSYADNPEREKDFKDLDYLINKRFVNFGEVRKLLEIYSSKTVRVHNIEDKVWKTFSDMKIRDRYDVDMNINYQFYSARYLEHFVDTKSLARLEIEITKEVRLPAVAAAYVYYNKIHTLNKEKHPLLWKHVDRYRKEMYFDDPFNEYRKARIAIEHRNVAKVKDKKTKEEFIEYIKEYLERSGDNLHCISKATNIGYSHLYNFVVKGDTSKLSFNKLSDIANYIGNSEDQKK